MTSLTEANKNFVVEFELSNITLIMELYSFRPVEDLKSKHDTTSDSLDKGIDSLKLENLQINWSFQNFCDSHISKESRT